MNRLIGIVTLACALAIIPPGCKRGAEQKPARNEAAAESESTHVHDDGSVHTDGSAHAGHADDAPAEGGDHAHDEAPLGTATIGDLQVVLAQGHGKVAAGKEGHLVVKLPYNDKGQTTVRAWIGTEDRLKSIVGKGLYAPSHDDYDVHAMAPTPLPEDVMWWIELEKPDGSKVVGSAKPLVD